MKDKGKLLILRAMFLVIMIACLIPVGRSCCQSIQHEQQSRKLRAVHEKSDSTGEKTGNAVGESAGSRETESEDTEKQMPAIAEKWKELYAKNKDLAGWLIVEGTKIDYPVMQCEDDEYYLHHNFEREEDKYGCLYVKSIADINTPGTNFVIYGHHMKDNSMFGDLDKYESESFYQEHGKILFDTLYEERIYEVIAAFRTQITEGEDDTGFKYYQFYQADTEDEFRNFYENVMKLSLYDTKATAEFGDTFLTLSTCSGYAENGRFVVVAKRITG